MIVAGADINLIVVNSLGEVVSKINLYSANEQKINLNNLPNGLYFIIGKNELGFVKQKIVISK